MERTSPQRLVVFLGLFVLALTALGAEARDTVIYLVRHGENVSIDPEAKPYDPPLSEAGLARGAELARVLRDVAVTRIFSTDFHRTRDTVAPLAKEKGLEVEIYDPERAHDLVRELRTRPGSYVVAGHSNTTPEMVRKLGGEPGEPIEHSEHDRLYILIFKEGFARPGTLLLRYGEVSKLDSHQR